MGTETITIGNSVISSQRHMGGIPRKLSAPLHELRVPKDIHRRENPYRYIMYLHHTKTSFLRRVEYFEIDSNFVHRGISLYDLWNHTEDYPVNSEILPDVMFTSVTSAIQVSEGRMT